MEITNYFRQQAARCRRLAQEVFDFKIIRRLFDLAEEFEEKGEEIAQQQERRGHSLEWSALNTLMVDNILFIYEATIELRDIATIAPEIDAKLRQMAEELGEKADEIAYARRDRLDRAEAS